MYVFNNRAYTLFESLIGLILMGILIGLCMNFIVVLQRSDNYNYAKEEMVVLLGQIQEDFLITDDYSVTKDTVNLETYNDDNISYTKDKNRLIRQVNNSGYEIMLTNIREVKFFEVGNTIKTTIEFTNNYIYEGVLGEVK